MKVALNKYSLVVALIVPGVEVNSTVFMTADIPGFTI